MKVAAFINLSKNFFRPTYYDHRDDIQAEIEEERRFVEEVKAKAGPSRLEEILKARKGNGSDDTLPPG